MSTFPTRSLGKSTLQITPIGLGAWAIGGEWQFGWGRQEDADSSATIRRAVDLGLNWIDTAPVYGLGRSEEVVGRALQEIPQSERPYLFTKCSLVWDEKGKVSHNLTTKSIRGEAEGSLRRLGVECIDLYQIHWPRWPASPADHDSGPLEEAWLTMMKLRDEGKIAFLGVSNFNTAQLEQIRVLESPTSLQPPYSMLRPEVEQEILPFCLKHGIGVLPYSPMQSGLLTGAMTRERVAALPEDDWRRGSRFFQEPIFSRAQELVAEATKIGERHGRNPGEVAVAWTLRHPAVTGTIVGARKPEQVDSWIGAATFRLSQEEADALTGHG
jgi:aryl-alcohol dehydrogenase-like predicted oxidoreductase